MAKQPMTLLGTTGPSNEAPVVPRHRVYMSQDGDLVLWVGKLELPKSMPSTVLISMQWM
jgi:hypothetical protein